MIAKPPLIQEIETLADKIAIETEALCAGHPVDFRHLNGLRSRHRELVSWARSNGWSPMPSDDQPPPTAPAVTLRAA